MLILPLNPVHNIFKYLLLEWFIMQFMITALPDFQFNHFCFSCKFPAAFGEVIISSLPWIRSVGIVSSEAWASEYFAALIAEAKRLTEIFP